MKIKSDDKLFKEIKSSCAELKIYSEVFTQDFAGLLQNDLTLSVEQVGDIFAKISDGKRLLKRKMKEAYDEIERLEVAVKEKILKDNK